MTKTYLVTGGAGFIGSNFVLYMLKKYEDIRIVNVDKLTYAGNLENLASVQDDTRHIFVKADICDTAAIASLFEQYEIDYVVNFAAESHVDRSISDPSAFVKTNVEGTVNLLQCAKNAWLCGDDEYRPGVKYLQVSTDEVYGTLRADEPDTFFVETMPLVPHSPYSASKAAADLFVQAFRDTYKLPVNITRCSNNYGPFQFPEKLIPLMYNNCLHHKDLPVYGDGLQIRDWLYVEDHCKAIDMVVSHGVDGEVYNVGGHNERTNITIVKTIIDYVHNLDASVDENLIKHVTDRKGHDRRYGIDPEKIRHDLGWFPETKFEDGIVKTLDWYQAHGEWVEHVVSGDYQAYYAKMYDGR
ncbi:MAG: dTDP-glucose 4,6-dehydratase [Eggerthellaceae bacterium]|jgi:dTDP-glucose 4,6-dehydratase